MRWPEPGPRRWLLRDVTVDGTPLDCRIADGRIAQLAPDLDPGDGPVADGNRGALLPGLADHHLHVIATAALRASVDLAGGTSLTLADDGSPDRWLRVVGAGAVWTRGDLDRRWPAGPVRIQHRSGRLWMLNSVAVGLLNSGLTETERRTGRLWDADRRLRGLLVETDSELPDLAPLGRDLAAHGVTHVTDASPDLSPDTVRAIGAEVPQHVVSMASSGTGPRKLVLSDIDLPHVDAVSAAITAAHRAGRPVAIHTVTEVTLAIAIAALTAVGALDGDRLEHAAMCSDAAALRIADLGLTVVTQPTIYARTSGGVSARHAGRRPPAAVASRRSARPRHPGGGQLGCAIRRPGPGGHASRRRDPSR